MYIRTRLSIFHITLSMEQLHSSVFRDAVHTHIILSYTHIRIRVSLLRG